MQYRCITDGNFSQSYAQSVKIHIFTFIFLCFPTTLPQGADLSRKSKNALLTERFLTFLLKNQNQIYDNTKV